ncbi:ATP-binding response regulator [Luteithermobacter gelatinilyticus]|uniref:ATP-binding response regulator n=1 Tax=Luteithermobacter gelatinilyticus TaxID=2582913 RepID=UPI0011075853|nr:hybrid sensor histidine kinase/response regulator [Luteithermobacter gelatinilyticus]
MLLKTRDRHLVAEQVKWHFDHVPSIMLLNSVVAIVVSFCIVQWVPIQTVILWLIAIIVLSGVRFGHCQMARQDEKFGDHARRHALALIIFSFSSGVVWGSLGLLLPVVDNVFVAVLAATLFNGLVAGSLASLSNYKPAYIAFVIPVALPFSLRCLLSNEDVLVMVGALGLIFLALNVFYSFLAEKEVARTIKLSLENKDLIERLKREKENAEAAREIAVRNNEAKTRFLATASHDLRQPLHAMGFFVEALVMEATTPKLVALAKKVDNSLEALRDLLTSLLDLSKIEAGILSPTKVHFDLGDIIEEIKNDFIPEAQAKGLSLEFEDCNDVIVYSDRAMLSRIIRNLISNAIRYTHFGFVKVHYERHPTTLAIQVSDSGPGIPADKCQEVFREFFQLGNPERDRQKGLGLGLSIVEGLCRLLKHPITLRSEEGKGTTFSVQIPLGDKTRIITPQERGKQLVMEQTYQILVIDDEESSRDSMREMISLWGHRVYAFEGPAAAELFIDFEGYEPDLIIADYRLKDGLTGDQAIRKLQASLGREVPGLIVTADTEKERIRDAKKSGFILLHKPVHPAKLRSVMTYIINQKDITQKNDLPTNS